MKKGKLIYMLFGHLASSYYIPSCKKKFNILLIMQRDFFHFQNLSDPMTATLC